MLQCPCLPAGGLQGDEARGEKAFLQMPGAQSPALLSDMAGALQVTLPDPLHLLGCESSLRIFKNLKEWDFVEDK